MLVVISNAKWEKIDRINGKNGRVVYKRIEETKYNNICKILKDWKLGEIEILYKSKFTYFGWWVCAVPKRYTVVCQICFTQNFWTDEAIEISFDTI